MKAIEFYKKSFEYPIYIALCTFPFSVLVQRGLPEFLRLIGGIALMILMISLFVAIPYFITVLILKIYLKNKNLKKTKQTILYSPLVLLVCEYIIFGIITIFLNDLEYGLIGKGDLYSFIFVTIITLFVGYLWTSIVLFIGKKIEKREINKTLSMNNNQNISEYQKVSN